MAEILILLASLATGLAIGLWILMRRARRVAVAARIVAAPALSIDVGASLWREHARDHAARLAASVALTAPSAILIGPGGERPASTVLPFEAA